MESRTKLTESYPPNLQNKHKQNEGNVNTYKILRNFQAFVFVK